VRVIPFSLARTTRPRINPAREYVVIIENTDREARDVSRAIRADVKALFNLAEEPGFRSSWAREFVSAKLVPVSQFQRFLWTGSKRAERREIRPQLTTATPFAPLPSPFRSIGSDGTPRDGVFR